MVKILFLHGINFLEKNPRVLQVLLWIQAYNDVHLRALYVLADLGGDHRVGWDERRPQSDKQESTVFL